MNTKQGTSATADLERLSELATAELGVAEELGWPLAVLAGALAQMIWGEWIASAPLAAASYWLATHRYRKRSAKADDEYYKAAHLGKYAQSQSHQPDQP